MIPALPYLYPLHQVLHSVLLDINLHRVRRGTVRNNSHGWLDGWTHSDCCYTVTYRLTGRQSEEISANVLFEVSC